MSDARNLGARSLRSQYDLRDIRTDSETSGFAESVRGCARSVVLRLPSVHRDKPQVLKWIDARRGRSHHHGGVSGMS